MKKMRKMLAVVTAVFVMTTAFSLTASAKGNSSDNKAKSNVVLTYIIDRDTEQSGYKAVMEKFTELTGIRFEEELRPGGSDGETILKTRFATGDAPDFIWFNAGSLMASLDPVKNFVDLTEQPYMEKLQDSYKQTVTVDDKVYGIPGTTSQAGGWLYNKELHEELGLSVPETWEELMENCEIAKEAGYTAVIASYKDSWTAQLIPLADYANVAKLVPDFAADFDANEAKFATTPEALRSFEKLAEVYEGGFMNEDYLATTYDLALEMLVNGEGLYYPMLTFALSNIYGTYGEDVVNNIGVFAQPADEAEDTMLTVWIPSGWYACSASENFEEVNQFFEFYLSEEGQDIFAATQRGDGPSVVIGANVPDNAYEGVKDMMIYFEENKTGPALEFVSSVKGPNLPQICVEVGAGMREPAEGAAEYDKDVEKQAQQLGLKGW